MKKLQLKTYTLVGIIGFILLFLCSIFKIGFYIPYVGMLCHMAFFVGYFVHQNEWTLLKKLTLVSIICYSTQLLFSLYWIFGSVNGITTYSSENGYTFLGIVLTIQSLVFSVSWIPFCFAIFNNKGIVKSIKWLSLSCVILELIKTYFQNFYDLGKLINVKLYADFIWDSKFIEIIWHYVGVVSYVTISALLVHMFILQHKNTKGSSKGSVE